MPCRVIHLGNGFTAIAKITGARRRPCVVCGAPHEKLCDGPKGKRTCNAALCGKHAYHVDPDTDYCPECKERLDRYQAALEKSNG